MTITVGPYEFTGVKYVNDGLRDWLELDMGAGSSITADEETVDGDLWFYPDNEARSPGGLHIERARERDQAGGLTVQLPEGNRVPVLGAESVFG